MDVAPVDTGTDVPVVDAHALMVARGDYVVRHVALCPFCHTPRDSMGYPDLSRFLAGDPSRPLVDIVPGDPTMGAVYVRNITPDTTTGIGSWTDEQIRNAFLNGLDDMGQPLHPAMPYWAFHNMSPEDADAVVAFLRTVHPVTQAVPDNQPLGFTLTAADPVPEAMIPHTTLPASDPNYASAEHGRYLAGNVGICAFCHTEPSTGSTIPVNVALLFAGNRAFPTADMRLASPPWPTATYSANLTPHANGITGWTALDVRHALQMSVDPMGKLLCPPMPAGPGGLGQLTDQDCLDIGYYLTTIPPVDAGPIPECTPPVGWHP